MQTMTPVPFLDPTTALIDLAGISAGAAPTLLTLDHGTSWHRPGPDLPPMEPALLRVWSMPSATRAASESARQTSELPHGFSAAMAVLDGRLATLVETNEVAAAWLTWASWTNPAPGVFAPPTPLALDPAVARSVNLAPDQDWSTLDLPAEAWMFHPAITADPAAKRFILAMNTADGQAVVWDWSPATPAHPPEPRTVVPAALDPLAVLAGGRRFLLFRAMPAGWAVFFGDIRYSSGAYPVPMPLMMGEIGAGGAIHDLVDLSATLGIGGVFAFAAHGDATGITLAAAFGTRAEPRLRLSIVNLAGQASPEPAEAALRAAPLRVALAQVGPAVLVGTMYRAMGRSTADAMVHHW